MTDRQVKVGSPIYINVDRSPHNLILQSEQYQYFFGLINASSFTCSFSDLPPDLTLYTEESVNDSFSVYCDGIKYYYYGNLQNYSDQFKIEGNLFTFLYEVSRLEIKYINRLILK